MERTEAPTGKRLNEARERGQVPHSIELNAAIALLVGFWLLRSVMPQLFATLQAMLIETLTTHVTDTVTGDWVREYFAVEGLRLVPQVGYITVVMAVTGVTVTLAQTGWLWAGKNIGFDFGRLNPLNGFKRLFSWQGIIQLARALLKLGVVGVVAYLFLRPRIEQIVLLGQLGIASAITSWAGLAYQLAWQVGSAYFVLAAVDYFYQRWEVTRALRMSKQEIKDEAKQSEGDPFIKGRIRGQMRRMARQRMLARVPKADVVITNPTHFAVALQYDKTAMHAPEVVAKGSAFMAQRIRETAREHKVPVIENPPVARALYAAVEIDQEIPAELYRAVAEILAFVYNLKHPRPVLVPTPPVAPAPQG